ncbi:MAG: hypothetical protein ABI315_03220 [Bacteroidia bacterium]
MNNQPHFSINSTAPLSILFLKQHINTFKDAATFIKQLPYGRNANKNDLTSIFTDNCGTCSTKHAVLKELAAENNFEGLDLMLGLFKMSAKNTPKISAILQKNKLTYFPEAHTYLKFNNCIFDYTTIASKPADFVNDLMEEIIIQPYQISDFKVDYHKKRLTDWLEKNPSINYTLNDVWAIREQCIQKLSETITKND